MTEEYVGILPWMRDQLIELVQRIVGGESLYKVTKQDNMISYEIQTPFGLSQRSVMWNGRVWAACPPESMVAYDKQRYSRPTDVYDMLAVREAFGVYHIMKRFGDLRTISPEILSIEGSKQNLDDHLPQEPLPVAPLRLPA